MKICNICKKEKELEDFNKDRCKKDGYMNFCKECRSKKHLLNKENNNKKSKEYYTKNKKVLNLKNKEYIQKNKEIISKKWKEYRKKNQKRNSMMSLIYQTNRRKSDPLYKLVGDIRSLILISFKKQGFSKKSKTFKILGCTSIEFKLHLEKQFKIHRTLSFEDYKLASFDLKKNNRKKDDAFDAIGMAICGALKTY